MSQVYMLSQAKIRKATIKAIVHHLRNEIFHSKLADMVNAHLCDDYMEEAETDEELGAIYDEAVRLSNILNKRLPPDDRVEL